MENSKSALCLDRLFLQRNTAVYRMNYGVCTSISHRALSVLGRVHVAFFDDHQMEEMSFMPDEIISSRMIAALDLEFEKTLHYHDERYECNNHYGLLPQVMRHIRVYSAFITKASFDPANFTTTQCQISPFIPSCPSLQFQEGVCWHLAFKEMPC